MAGPMGQCFPLPDDENLKEAMAKHAHNHEFIFNQYNFDVDTPAGSDMEKAERLWRRKKAVEARESQRKSQMERRRLQRLEKRRGPKRDQPPAASTVRLFSHVSGLANRWWITVLLINSRGPPRVHEYMHRGQLCRMTSTWTTTISLRVLCQ